MIRILISDDDKNLRTVLANELSSDGHDVTGVDSGAKAIDLIRQDEFDVLLLDLNMPRLDGISVLRELSTTPVSTQVIVLTGHGTVSTAVEAMKLGAYDFLTKPFKIEDLRLVIDRAYEKKRLLSENRFLKAELKRQAEAREIVTQSPLMAEILETVKKVAVSDFPIVIYGESGVGKELVARAIHDASTRADGPFIPLNCGAIPESMLESELFGHERGAFTGAQDRKPGLLEMAGNGTFFLDEIGELPLPLQVKLLRVIETSRFFRVGGVKEVRVDTKFVSASNKDLKAEVERGTFRADLYYRISALTLHIPPLRERREDIPVLIEHFRKKNPAFKQKRFGKEAVEILTRYDWPGNVRELQNVVHRTLLLTRDDVIVECDLPADLVDCRKPQGKRLSDMEREYILSVLRQTGGHRGKAAEILGIDPKTLYRKLQDYGVRE